MLVQPDRKQREIHERPGGPKIEIGYRKNGEETVFFAKDNGIGIDPKEHEKVFSLFYQVDRKSGGAGAGLSIVKRIIEVHGGRIWMNRSLAKDARYALPCPLLMLDKNVLKISFPARNRIFRTNIY